MSEFMEILGVVGNLWLLVSFLLLSIHGFHMLLSLVKVAYDQFRNK